MTGAAGFAGQWLVRDCASAGDQVWALSRAGDPVEGASDNVAVDLRDLDQLRRCVVAAQPEAVYHLAALSSVAKSWQEPGRTLSENVAGAVNVLEAVRDSAAGARVIWVSTCEVYGVPDRLPIGESAAIAPANPYAVSKAAGELLAAVYAESHGLDVVVARPFSHSGPGQLPIFLLSSLAMQAAEGRRAGVERLTIVTGNPATRRDFMDVRDVVRAYRLLATTPSLPDRVYNVSSGVSVSAAEQVSLLAELMAPIAVDHEIDPARVRASEVMDLRGDHSRLTAATGWEPEIDLRQTMDETIAWWERALAR
ncbi:MAG: GDP-mannose 4,6-dehydratase [Solirubrobacteraceae bacterium]